MYKSDQSDQLVRAENWYEHSWGQLYTEVVRKTGTLQTVWE